MDLGIVFSFDEKSKYNLLLFCGIVHYILALYNPVSFKNHVCHGTFRLPMRASFNVQ